ncbi:Phage integrase family protein [Prauserella marina]|uniref:Phage integrase family protein n=1 Tax=Prauserella marina TaxID=530584 RepID=A0A1G6TTW3_9PSEU|nr:phage integrase family protein [Prauserella marina]SDD31896.1 Phage integrase family protein [Prauserella marina]
MAARCHSADVSDAFAEIVRRAGLPPITLHGLRHGAATLALAAGADMKSVQHMLRHSSIKVTMDLYTNVLREVSQATANAIADIIPRQSKQLPGALGLPSGSPTTTVDREEVKEMVPENTKLQVAAIPDLECEGAPSGTRTPNPLVKSQLLCQLS